MRTWGQRAGKPNNSQKPALGPLCTSLFSEGKSCRDANDNATESPFLAPTAFDSDILQDKGQGSVFNSAASETRSEVTASDTCMWFQKIRHKTKQNKNKKRPQPCSEKPAPTTIQPTGLTSTSTFSVNLFPTDSPHSHSYLRKTTHSLICLHVGRDSTVKSAPTHLWRPALPSDYSQNNLATKASASPSCRIWCWAGPSSLRRECA